MSFDFKGLATLTPSASVNQTQAADLASRFCVPTPAQARLLPVLYRRTTVRTRHSVLLGSQDCDDQDNGDRGLTDDVHQSFYQAARDEQDRGPTTALRMQAYEKHAAVLGVAAAQLALRNSLLDASLVTHLVTVSCTGFSAPGLDIGIIRKLGLSADVARTNIGFMGCHGALNAIRVAQAFVHADRRNHVLVCAVELCSLHHQYGWHPERIVSNALFADGAAAFLAVDSSESNHGHRDLPRHIASGSYIVPNTESMMSWRISDHGYEMTLSPLVPDIIRRELRGWLSGWLNKQGYALEQIGGWAVHPGGPRILDATADALGLSADCLQASRDILKQYGNMSSPTVLFVLDELRRKSTPGPHVMLGFGPGLAIEAALVD